MFAKEFAFCIPEAMYEEIARMPNIQHTFLIRDPKRAITSYFKTSNNLTYKDEFLQSEAGFKELCDFYRIVKRFTSLSPIVIDAYDLQANPAETLKLYCEGIGIHFEPQMTTWKQGTPIPGVNRCWEEWVSAVVRSNGIIQADYRHQRVHLDGMPKDILNCIDECQSYYEEMFAERTT